MDRTAHPTRPDEIRILARQLAEGRIAPEALARDESGKFPREEMRFLAECDLLGLTISENDGGMGADRTDFAAVAGEIARACASTALVYVTHAIVAKAVELAASEAVKAEWLPRLLRGDWLGAFAVHEAGSGSDAAAIATSARREDDSYLVNGSKFLVTSGGEADLYLALARTGTATGPQGLTALLVEKGTPGLSFGRAEDKMGLRSTSSRELFFENCRVPARNRLGDEGGGPQVIGRAAVGWGFFGAAGISVGIAQSAADIAVKHAKERTISGEPIGAHQAVRSLIAEMILGAEAANALLLACAARADSAPESAVANAFKAKLFASEVAVDVANKAIQVLGGHGYCRDYIVERLFRDARGLLLHFKTSELLRQDIAKGALRI
jgi:butyryl-CoA dehydrogenase